MQFKHILCVIPQIAEAESCVRIASTIAERHGSSFSCLHVIQAPDSWNVLFPQRHAAQAADRARAVSDASERLVEIIALATGRASKEFGLVVESGPFDTTVVLKAQELGCDLIVIPDRSFDRILRHAHCAVLIARPERERGGILAASDLSDPSLPALAAAARASEVSGTPLTAMFSLNAAELNAMGPGMEFASYVYSQSEIDQMTETARDQMREALSKIHAKGSIVIEHGPAAEAILRTAHSLDSNLIVLGTTGRSLLPRLLLGSVAEAVAHRASCSVLVVRKHDSAQEAAA